MITAVSIKKLLVAETTDVKADLTKTTIEALIKSGKEIKNVHQETWSFEEAEGTATPYKNELTGGVYRVTRDKGDVTMNFTLGQYTLEDLKTFKGGTVLAGVYKRGAGVEQIHKCLLAQTKDGIWIILPKAEIVARSAYGDGAVGQAVVGTALEPDGKDVSTEYWYDPSVGA